MAVSKPSESPLPGGRQRLIDAALRLAARRSAVSSLGLRELSREAGLNPNTFYRHFADLDALSIAIVEQLADELRKRRQEARESAPDFAAFAARSIESYFEFAAEHPEAFIVGFRELSLQTAASSAIRRVMDEIADELSEVTLRQGLLTDRDAATVREIASFVVSGLFLLAIEYIERKAQRRAILAKANRYVALLITGAFSGTQKPKASTAKKSANRTTTVR